MFIVHLRKHNVAFGAIKGLHIDMVAGDLMHIVLLGIAHHLIGSVLCELLEERFWGGPITGEWKHLYDLQFATHIL